MRTAAESKLLSSCVVEFCVAKRCFVRSRAVESCIVKLCVIGLCVAGIGVVGVGEARGDRPGSYDNVLGGQQQQAGVGRGAGHGAHYGAGHGVLRHHPRSRSSIHLSVGTPFPFCYSPVFSHGAFYSTLPAPYWNPYGIYYNPNSQAINYYLPPTFMPAELMYGPQAMDRFLGIQRPPPMAAPAAIPAPVAAPAARGLDNIVDRLRKSNATTRARALRYVQFGDALYTKQRFHEAAQRYRTAIEVAPDLPEAYYRQGFALIAVKQYRLATKALRIAVQLDPEMLRTDTLLRKLYGDNHLVQATHLEQLADKALTDPEDGDLMFLIGAFLSANGEEDKGAKFLHRARELAGPDATYLDALLTPLPPPAIDAVDDAGVGGAGRAADGSEIDT